MFALVNKSQEAHTPGLSPQPTQAHSTQHAYMGQGINPYFLETNTHIQGRENEIAEFNHWIL